MKDSISKGNIYFKDCKIEKLQIEHNKFRAKSPLKASSIIRWMIGIAAAYIVNLCLNEIVKYVIASEAWQSHCICS